MGKLVFSLIINISYRKNLTDDQKWSRVIFQHGRMLSLIDNVFIFPDQPKSIKSFKYNSNRYKKSTHL